MALEPTNEQAMDLALATGFGETRGMHVAMLLWPLVRDMVLEEARRAIVAERVGLTARAEPLMGLSIAARVVQGMKGG